MKRVSRGLLRRETFGLRRGPRDKRSEPIEEAAQKFRRPFILGLDLLKPVSALGAPAIQNQAKIARARERSDTVQKA